MPRKFLRVFSTKGWEALVPIDKIYLIERPPSGPTVVKWRAKNSMCSVETDDFIKDIWDRIE